MASPAPAADCSTKERKIYMLWTITVILLVLWLLGMVTSYTLGGMLHILLALAIIMAIVSLFTGRRAGPPV